MQGRYVPSLLAAIGGIVERHLGVAAYTDAPAAQCGASALIKSEGCTICLKCSHSKCG